MVLEPLQKYVILFVFLLFSISIFYHLCTTYTYPFANKHENDRGKYTALSQNSKLGHGTWILLNKMFAQYNADSEQEQQDLKTFVTLLLNYYPCQICRIHAQKYLVNHPLTDETMSSHEQSIKWLIDFHNDVNVRLNKPEYSEATFTQEWLQADCRECDDY
jgi:cbb3-type cytochrome oxidase subunit 3